MNIRGNLNANQITAGTLFVHSQHKIEAVNGETLVDVSISDYLYIDLGVATEDVNLKFIGKAERSVYSMMIRQHGTQAVNLTFSGFEIANVLNTSGMSAGEMILVQFIITENNLLVFTAGSAGVGFDKSNFKFIYKTSRAPKPADTSVMIDGILYDMTVGFWQWQDSSTDEIYEKVSISGTETTKLIKWVKYVTDVESVLQYPVPTQSMILEFSDESKWTKSGMFIGDTVGDDYEMLVGQKVTFGGYLFEYMAEGLIRIPINIGESSGSKKLILSTDPFISYGSILEFIIPQESNLYVIIKVNEPNGINEVPDIISLVLPEGSSVNNVSKYKFVFVSNESSKTVTCKVVVPTDENFIYSEDNDVDLFVNDTFTIESDNKGMWF